MIKSEDTIGDFKAYYCTTTHRHIWVLGYFGGGAINFSRYEAVAKEFAELCDVPIDTVQIDEIHRSRRHLRFKFMTSTAPIQHPIADSEQTPDVMGWLMD